MLVTELLLALEPFYYTPAFFFINCEVWNWYTISQSRSWVSTLSSSLLIKWRLESICQSSTSTPLVSVFGYPHLYGQLSKSSTIKQFVPIYCMKVLFLYLLGCIDYNYHFLCFIHYIIFYNLCLVVIINRSVYMGRALSRHLWITLMKWKIAKYLHPFNRLVTARSKTIHQVITTGRISVFSLKLNMIQTC